MRRPRRHAIHGECQTFRTGPAIRSQGRRSSSDRWVLRPAFACARMGKPSLRRQHDARDAVGLIPSRVESGHFPVVLNSRGFGEAVRSRIAAMAQKQAAGPPQREMLEWMMVAHRATRSCSVLERSSGRSAKPKSKPLWNGAPELSQPTTPHAEMKALLSVMGVGGDSGAPVVSRQYSGRGWGAGSWDAGRGVVNGRGRRRARTAERLGGAKTDAPVVSPHHQPPPITL